MTCSRSESMSLSRQPDADRDVGQKGERLETVEAEDGDEDSFRFVWYTEAAFAPAVASAVLLLLLLCVSALAAKAAGRSDDNNNTASRLSAASPTASARTVMELADIRYSPAEYIETAQGNKVCRKSVLCGSQNIMLHGKTIIQSDCIIRGDLANVKIGRYCVISARSVIRPPFKKFSKGVAFLPMTIGDHVFIGEDTIVNAAVIGSYVYIGNNCVIGKHCILKDCCAVADDTVLPQGTVVAAFAVYSGSPGRLTSELPECTQDVMIDHTKSYYEHFKQAQAP